MIDMDAAYDSSRSTHVSRVVYGMMGLYDRSTIKYGEFLQNAETISNQIRIFEINFDREYFLVDYLSNDLVEILIAVFSCTRKEAAEIVVDYVKRNQL